ncbi:hypothetical protein HRJ45_02725 [Vibrio coralliilyticus]|uniref:hypothetical protein n=1 Tax=Vibrio coralliilyticus TaxID=190893 RepID=UPI0015610F9A|nr:hypothetical protein [Vibrio coralliilyticus]NRF24196.1 hypothetical protein [Vibrio coralliilyticus]NRF78006.1 hypothetical protein [Vibrio coralliilyticus]
MIELDYLVQVTKLPSDLQSASGDVNHHLYDTYEIYQLVIDSNLLWRVWLIDEYDQVWLEVNFINSEGEAEFHTIKVDQGTYNKVDFDRYQALDKLE